MNPEEIEADAKQPQGDLSLVSKKAKQLIQAYKELSELEEKIKEKSKEIHQIESLELPNIMESCNIEDFKLTDGFEVQIKSIVKAGLPTKSAIEKQKDPDLKAEMESRLQRGLKWLRENKGEEIIKNTVSLEFSKGQDNIVGDFIGKADELKIPYNRQQTVHPSTLSNFVKEKMKQGANVPKEDLGVYCGKKAVVKKSG